MRSLLAITAALLLSTSMAFAATDSRDSPNDPNSGQGNDGSTHEGPGTGGGHPGGSGPGQSLLDGSTIIFAAGDNVAPGSGNWGGGPGNSGAGDKGGQNDKSKDGGQTPNDDK